jgi:serine/threonine protein kinase/Tol biopolymer transport system component
MNPDRWRQVADVYEVALEREPAARAAFLSEACRADPDLRREVESLLAHEHTSLVVDRDMLAVAAVVLEGVSRLEPGTSVGPYRIEALIGAGGMGEVYRARDTKLDRDVALKVLPESLTHDLDRLTRFSREAHVLASLNHPNIAAIHGFEDRGDVHALVLELVEGPTLADRIGRRPLSLPEALPIARQIADALAAAHEHGVIHRDLKPANIKVRDDGTVKVLDFGLAKPLQDAASAQSESEPPLPALQSPTVMSPVVTATGVILGTAAYMSPEQAKGRAADKRVDVWAFGCVIYETLTGKRAFNGDDVSDTVASVLKSQPDWTALPNDTPAAIRRLLRRSLEKDPRRRLSDMADARLEIDEAEGFAGADTTPEAGPRVTTRVRPPLAWTIAATLAVALISAIVLWSPWRVGPLPVSEHLSVDLGADAFLGGSLGGMLQLAISPDGSMLAFVGERDGVDRLYLRRFAQLQALPLVTGQVSEPFFSPDGEWIGFFSIADHKLKKIRVAGGAAVAICDIDTLFPRGASWGDDGFIVFNPDAAAWTPLLRVPAAGGKPEPFSTLSEGEIAHRWPQVLPGAHALLYASFGTQGGIDASNIVAQRRPSGPSKIVIRGAHYARYLRSGHLVYAQGAALFAVPFDVNRLEVTGQPVAIVQGVTTYTVSGAPLFAVSDAGTLAYVPGDLITTDAPMMWMRRDGTMTPMRSIPRDWRSPQFSPDGKRIAFHVDDGRQLDVYTYEWARDFTTRLTSDPAVDSYPVWSPDGRTIVFASSRGVKQLANLYWASADGSGEAHRLTSTDDRQLATSWHPSGKYLAFDQQISPQQWDLMVLPMDVSGSGWKAGTATRVMSRIAQRPTAVFSPDGRWLAYTSNESGRSEVFVRSFPGPGAQWQVSTSGGWVPTWSRRRNELVYLSLLPDSHLMVVSYTIEGDTFRAGPPRKWSEQPISGRPTARSFDLHPDGDRIVASGDLTTTTNVDKVVLVSNFMDEVRRRLSDARR